MRSIHCDIGSCHTHRDFNVSLRQGWCIIDAISHRDDGMPLRLILLDDVDLLFRKKPGTIVDAQVRSQTAGDEVMVAGQQFDRRAHKWPRTATGAWRDALPDVQCRTHPRAVHPLAVKAMAELDIDISERAGHRAKDIEEFAEEPPMDQVMMVCDEAAEECPYFPRARRKAHWRFPDPSAATGSEEERLGVFRNVRDAIVARIETFVRQDQEERAE